jgi:hypothetical protein
MALEINDTPAELLILKVTGAIAGADQQLLLAELLVQAQTAERTMQMLDMLEKVSKLGINPQVCADCGNYWPVYCNCTPRSSRVVRTAPDGSEFAGDPVV